MEFILCSQDPSSLQWSRRIVCFAMPFIAASLPPCMLYTCMTDAAPAGPTLYDSAKGLLCGPSRVPSLASPPYPYAWHARMWTG